MDDGGRCRPRQSRADERRPHFWFDRSIRTVPFGPVSGSFLMGVIMVEARIPLQSGFVPAAAIPCDRSISCMLRGFVRARERSRVRGDFRERASRFSDFEATDVFCAETIPTRGYGDRARFFWVRTSEAIWRDAHPSQTNPHRGGREHPRRTDRTVLVRAGRSRRVSAAVAPVRLTLSRPPG